MDGFFKSDFDGLLTDVDFVSFQVLFPVESTEDDCFWQENILKIAKSIVFPRNMWKVILFLWGIFETNFFVKL